MPKRWLILITLLLVVALIAGASTYGVWSRWSGGDDAGADEAFTGAGVETIKGSTRNCKVYYTSNVDICDRPLIGAVSDSGAMNVEVDTNQYNYYPLGKPNIQAQITRLEGVGTARTSTQNAALADLKRALADIDAFPFKNTCMLDMAGMKESSAHPRKINQDYDAGRRGDPLHWAFCYYPQTAMNQPVRESAPFKRVFKDTAVDYTEAGAAAGATALRRYDMKSMYNDDLLNLHCRLYTESLINGGSSVSAFNGMRFMEWTLDAAATATSRTIQVRNMRPVRVRNGLLVSETNLGEIKKAYLALIELTRTATAMIHRPKAFQPTFYRFMFHLCSAPQAETAAGETLIYDKLIQLAVPKNLPQVFRIPSTQPVLSEAYNYINNSPMGDISDMQFDISELDKRV